MKKMYLLVIVVFSLLFIISCSIPNLYEENDDISYIKGNHELKFTNRSNQTIYYFIVEQETASYIEWVPSVNGPSIARGKNTVISLSKICTGENQTLRSGSKVNFYYWNAPSLSKYEIKGVVIEI